MHKLKITQDGAFDEGKSDESGKNQENEEEGGEEEEEEEAEKNNDEDDVDDLQIAWEALEVIDRIALD